MLKVLNTDDEIKEDTNNGHCLRKNLTTPTLQYYIIYHSIQ